MCKRGDIYLADCGHGDSGSSRQRGVRPVLVVSNDKANTHSPVVTVVPLTSQTRKKQSLPTHVLIPCSKGHGLTRPSVALAEQVTAIDKDRLTKLWGHVTDQGLMAEVTAALLIQIGASVNTKRGGVAMRPYENLANAIILRAVEDYREALHDLKVNPRYPPALHTVSEVERFFRSEWFSVLTNIDGVSLMEKLKEECDEYDG